MNEQFNPNNDFEDPALQEIRARREAQAAEDEKIAKAHEAEHAKIVQAEAPKNNVQEPSTALGRNSLDMLDSTAFKDEDMRILAIKFLLSEFSDLATAIQSINTQVISLNKSLPELHTVIDNYCEVKKTECSEEITNLEERVAAINSVLIKTASNTIVLTSDELNKAIDGAIKRLDSAVDQNTEKFNESVDTTTKSLKGYLNKNGILTLVFIFFLQLLIFGIFTIFMKL